MILTPQNDGITHINVYSKGKTALGRWLTNFAHTPIDTIDGHFESIEGYWYWLGTDNPKREQLRTLYGYAAKELGRSLKSADWQDNDEFKMKILNAIKIKLNNNQEMLYALFDNTLPLVHYYVYGETSNNPKIVEPQSGKWILDYLNTFFDVN